MADSTGGQGLKRERDNLGWLASSSTLPKRKRDIEGVSGTSILELQAQLYRTQEHVRLRKDGVIDPSEKHVRRTTGFNVAELMKGRNAGVAERDHKDRLEVKSTSDRHAECQAALERKAQLYAKLARGEVDDDGEQYEVDFLRKGWRDDEGPPAASTSYGLDGGAVDTMEKAVLGSGAMMSDDMRRERERRAWEQDEMQKLQEDEGLEKRRKQKQELLLMGEQTREERERAQALKQRKEEAETSKRDRLREAFLKQQLAKLKGRKPGAGQPGGAGA